MNRALLMIDSVLIVSFDQALLPVLDLGCQQAIQLLCSSDEDRLDALAV